MHYVACSFQKSEPLGRVSRAKCFIILVNKALKDPVQTFQDRIAVARAFFPRNGSDLSSCADSKEQAQNSQHE